MLVTSRDSESWRRPAAIPSSWEWFSTMAEGRSPSATVLVLRQCLACGRDSNSRGLRGAVDAVAIRHSTYEVMTHIDVGDDNSTPEQNMVRADRVELSQAF